MAKTAEAVIAEAIERKLAEKQQRWQGEYMDAYIEMQKMHPALIEAVDVSEQLRNTLASGCQAATNSGNLVGVNLQNPPQGRVRTTPAQWLEDAEEGVLHLMQSNRGFDVLPDDWKGGEAKEVTIDATPNYYVVKFTGPWMVGAIYARINKPIGLKDLNIACDNLMASINTRRI